MSTGDYLPGTDTGLASLASHVIRAQVTHPDIGVLELPLTAGGSSVSVTFDEAQAPRVEASIQTPIVAGSELVDARTGARLELFAGYVRDDGSEDVQLLADLGLRRTPRSHAAGILTLVARSDEALVIDASPAVAEKITAMSPAAAVTSLLGKTLSPAPYVEDNLTTSGTVTLDPIEDRWAALQDLADRYGAQVFDDGTRTWHAMPSPSSLAPVPDHVIAPGDGGTLLDVDEGVDRDQWANYVRVRYRWRTGAGADAQVIATAYVSTGPYAVTGPAGRRILEVDRDAATTQAEANAVARAMLLRALSRAESLEVRAVAAYWLRPGHTVDVQLPRGGRRVRHLVSRVSFDPVDGTMTLRTRLPLATPEDLETIATTTPPPDPATPSTPKPPVADPAPPARVAYVTEWPASSTAVYRGNGTKRSDVDPGELFAGTFSGSYNGNQRSLALFTAANSVQVKGRRSELGKTVTQALSGGAVLTKVEVVGTLSHSWKASGGDVVLGYCDVTAAPSSSPTVRAVTTSTSWPRDSTRVVNITRSDVIRDLVDGSCRAVTSGPGKSTSTTYYTTLTNVRLRLSYSK